MGKIMLQPEFMKPKEWEEYGCDYLDTECYHSFSGYGMGLKKGAPEWLVRVVKDHAKKLHRIDAEEKRTGKITGKNWAEALVAFDSESQSIEKFHKEVVIPLLREQLR